jgi:hypothetical protein
MFSLNTQHIIYHLSTHIIRRLLLPGIFFTLFLFPATAQEIPDTIKQTLPVNTDTVISLNDSLVIDTLAGTKPVKKKTELEAEVKYASDDSMSISISGQKIYLYNKAVVNYQNIGLKADYIEFNLLDHTVSANGVPDSSGSLAGKPVFSQGSEEFDSDTMKYNFDSHKGIIKYIVSKQGDGYLHSERTKRLSDGEIHVARGKYTTCDAPHPHFYIHLTKAIVIPDKKIISGPAYMVLEDIPLPLALPFGFFPNTTTRSSGLIIPTYGEEKTRGFYLRDGGWYFVLGEHVDLTLLGTVYSRGSWGVKGSSVYRKRYKYSGRFNVDYMKNRVIDDPTFVPSTDFKIEWSHQQDAKANPNQKFTASVNLSSSSYEKRQSNNVNDMLTNTKSSRISYYRQWGDKFNLTANLQESQNSKSHLINLGLPNLVFNMNRVYPFRAKDSDGKKWLDKVQISYNSKLENKITAPDSTIFTSQTLKNMQNGFQHSIPISMQGIKLFKFINITPTLAYNGVLYSNYTKRRNSPDSTIFVNGSPRTDVDTIRKITYAQSLSTALSISASPKIYGMYMTKNPNSHIIAVRHVMTPSASLSFMPDMSSIMPNYYRKISYPYSITKPSTTEEYSIYEHNIYGTPTVNGRSGSVGLSLNNTLEMKVRAKTDSTIEEKKVSLLDNFNFGTSYNPFAKSFQWAPVNFTGSTKLFNKQLDMRFGATFDPYAQDSLGHRVDKYLINENHKLFRTTTAYIDLGFNLKSPASGKSAEVAPGSEPDPYMDETNPTLDLLNESTAYASGAYVNFDIPWSLNVDYGWRFTKQNLETVYTHTVRLSGDISITPKWKIGVNTGYDFVSKKVTLTNISVHRDLHCWEMRFNVVPFGERRSYSFTINAKSSILRDVKYNKSKSWYDNF